MEKYDKYDKYEKYDKYDKYDKYSKHSKYTSHHHHRGSSYRARSPLYHRSPRHSPRYTPHRSPHHTPRGSSRHSIRHSPRHSPHRPFPIHSRSRSRSRSPYRPPNRYNSEIERIIEEGRRQALEAKRFDCTVFMYSLGHGVNERKIFDFFSEYNVGTIIDIKLLRDSKTKKSKNCCYVEFDSKEKAELAIGLNGKKLCGVPCQIVASQAEKNRYALAAKYKKLSKQNGDAGINGNV